MITSDVLGLGGAPGPPRQAGVVLAAGRAGGNLVPAVSVYTAANGTRGSHAPHVWQLSFVYRFVHIQKLRPSFPTQHRSSVSGRGMARVEELHRGAGAAHQHRTPPASSRSASRTFSAVGVSSAH